MVHPLNTKPLEDNFEAVEITEEVDKMKIWTEKSLVTDIGMSFDRGHVIKRPAAPSQLSSIRVFGASILLPWRVNIIYRTLTFREAGKIRISTSAKAVFGTYPIRTRHISKPINEKKASM
jgi:hypothetical protein